MPNERDYAVVVGITKYPDISDLKGPRRDAQAFIEWLLRTDGGNVPEANIKKALTSEEQDQTEDLLADDARPQRDDIVGLFSDFIKKGVSDPFIGRRLYVFMAGHGLGDSDDMNTAALYVANANTIYALCVQATVYVDWFRRAAAFEEIILIMDSCRTVHPMAYGGIPSLPKVFRPALAKRVKIFYGYATAWGSVARERDFGGETWGLFTKALLIALDSALPDQHGHVTGTAIENWIHNGFSEIANVGNEPPTDPPTINADKRNDIVWVKRDTPNTKQLTVKLDPFMGDEVIRVLDGTRTIVEDRTALASTETFDLIPGLYKVSVLDMTRSQTFELLHDQHVCI